MSRSGSVESSARRRARRNSIERAILATLSTAAIGTVALMAPKVLSLLKQTDPDWVVPRNAADRLRETLYRLRKKKLVRFERGKPLELTEAGRRRVSDIALGIARIKKPMRWDGRWRVLVFDIPEKFSKSRARLRSALERLGFVRLQDSVWVHPYDCEELVSLVKIDTKARSGAVYMVADAIENDSRLRTHFGLPLNR